MSYWALITVRDQGGVKKTVPIVLENEASRGKGNLRAGRYGIYTQVPRTTFRSGIRV